MEVVRHVNDMSCWTIVEHVYGIFTLIINSSFHKLLLLLIIILLLLLLIILFVKRTVHYQCENTIDVFNNSPTTHNSTAHLKSSHHNFH